MKPKEINLYIDLVSRIAKMSHAKRLQVGAVIAKPGGILLAYGYNGMPSGMDNTCETNNVTNPEVIHAEANAILKCAREGRSTEGAWLFLTHSPCIECAKMILQSGITSLVYITKYKDESGINLLKRHNVAVHEII